MSAVAVVSTLAMAQIQTVDGVGSVDWGKKVVIAKGIGVPNPSAPQVAARPMAIRAARTVALRNALELIKGIQVSSETTIENFMVQSDVVTSNVQGYIKSFKMGEPKYMSDKSIEITVEVPIGSVLMESVMPAAIKEVPGPVETTAVPEKGQNFTGLIIDARGLGVIPSLGPKIFDDTGKEIYGSAYVSRKFAVKWGMAGYAKTPEQAAKQVDRVGENPGIIKAIKGKGASKCDLVLGLKDAESVLAAAKSMKFLADCRVIIIVD